MEGAQTACSRIRIPIGIPSLLLLYELFYICSNIQPSSQLYRLHLEQQNNNGPKAARRTSHPETTSRESTNPIVPDHVLPDAN